MSLARVKTWAASEVLTAADLNAEFNNILNNALALISPLTGDLDVSGNKLKNLGAGTSSAPSLYLNGQTGVGLYFGSSGTGANVAFTKFGNLLEVEVFS